MLRIFSQHKLSKLICSVIKMSAIETVPLVFEPHCTNLAVTRNTDVVFVKS